MEDVPAVARMLRCFRCLHRGGRYPRVLAPTKQGGSSGEKESGAATGGGEHGGDGARRGRDGLSRSRRPQQHPPARRQPRQREPARGRRRRSQPARQRRQQSQPARRSGRQPQHPQPARWRQQRQPGTDSRPGQEPACLRAQQRHPRPHRVPTRPQRGTDGLGPLGRSSAVSCGGSSGTPAALFTQRRGETVWKSERCRSMSYASEHEKQLHNRSHRR